MPPIDPFAPATHPRHPSQAGRKRANHERGLRQAAADIEAYEELALTHLTPAERDLRDNPEATETEASPPLPPLHELRVRVDALLDTRQGMRQDGLNESDIEAPRIVDVFGVEHVLRVSDDGAVAHWEPVAVGYDDMKVAELKGLLVERELSVVGNKPDLVARLIEDDAAQAVKEETAQGEQANGQ
jgi:hypothetical protein